MYKTVSVCIITFNRSVLLDKCLNSIKNQIIKPFEVIVVDNYKKDSAKNIVDSYKNDLNIKYFYEENVGVGYARNRCIVESLGDIISFIDDDAFATTNWIKNIIHFHNKYKEYAAIVGESISYSKNKYIELYSNILHKNFFKKNLLNNNKILVLDTKNSSIKKDYIDKYKINFDIRCKRNGEDIDFGYKLIQKKEKIKYVKEIVVYHIERQNVFSFFRQRYFRYENHITYLKWKDYDFVKKHKQEFKEKHSDNDLRENLLLNKIKKIGFIEKSLYLILHKTSLLIEELGVKGKIDTNVLLGILITSIYRFYYNFSWPFFSFFNKEIIYIVTSKNDCEIIFSLLNELNSKKIYPATIQAKNYLEKNNILFQNKVGYPYRIFFTSSLFEKQKSNIFSKTLDFVIKNQKIKKDIFYLNLFPNNKLTDFKKNISYSSIIVYSEYQKKIFLKNKIDSKLIKVVGSPAFLALSKNKIQNCVKENSVKKLTILYLPTWNIYNSVNLMIPKLEKLNEKFNLIIKPHYKINAYYVKYLKEQNFYIYDEFKSENLLASVDIIISDLEEDFFKYLLINKPMYFLKTSTLLFDKFNSRLDIKFRNIIKKISVNILEADDLILNLSKKSKFSKPFFLSKKNADLLMFYLGKNTK